jgi:hypothetical protein
MKFEYDEEKAALNEINHDVSFDEAETAFEDDFSLIFPDVWHSAAEERFILLGESGAGRLLMVSYTFRGSAIRLISAREATPRERRKYVKENRKD